MKKFKGSALMMTTVIASAILSGLALTSSKISQSAIRSMGVLKYSTQAEQYAIAEATLVKATAYSDLTARSKVEIQNSNGYSREIILSAESDYSDNVKQRIATVNIYKDDETLPRYTLNVLKTDAEVEASGGGVPVGTIIAWPGSTAPTEGGTWLLCNGDSFSSITYPLLYSVLGKTTLPSLNGRFLEGTTNTPGSTKSAGLPNITGTFGGSYHGRSGRGEFGTGAFYVYGYQGVGAGDNSNQGVTFGFDASTSNSLYGAADTVQPKSYTVRFYIKAE